MTWGRHQNKDIRRALDAAREAGMDVVPTDSGHRWGYVACPRRDAPPLSVWSTPKVPENMARRIAKYTIEHRHEEG